MSTKNFPSTVDPLAYKPEYNNQVAQKPDKPGGPPKAPEADPLAYKPEYNQFVKKKDGGNTSSDGGSQSVSASTPDGNIAAPPATAPIDPNGLTPEQNEVYQAANSGPKMSNLYAKTYDILNKTIPQSSDPKINQQRTQLLTQVKNGDQSAIISAKQFIKTGIQKQIDQIKEQSLVSVSGGRSLAAPVFSPSQQQKQQLDDLQKQQDDIDNTMNDFAVNAAANDKGMQAQIRAEVSGKQYAITPNIAAEDLGKQIEKIRGGLSNPNGNIQYERQRAGLNAIIDNKQMKINDLISEGLKSKNQTLLQQASKEQEELKLYQGKADNLIDNFPDVAITQTARFIGDEIANTHPRNMIISKSDVLESAARIEKQHPGFIDKFGKYINTVAESEGSGIGMLKSGLVPKGGITGGLETGLNEYLFNPSVASLLGDKKTAEVENQFLAQPALQGTRQSGIPTKVIYDDKGKAYKETANEDYGKINWNSSMRFIGQSLPGLMQWAAAESATAGAATFVGAGKKAADLYGIIGASYLTSYDANHKLADNLIDDNTSIGEGRKNAIAGFLTLTTAGIFHAIGYSPTKFVENAVTKSIAPDALKLFEESGWQTPTKKATQEFLSDVVMPKAKTFAVETAKSVGMGAKVAGATVADQKIKDFTSQVINPEKAQASTVDDNVKSFAQQALFMTLIGLPKAVVSGFSSPSGKDALYEIGTRAPQYIDQINDKLSNGEYTQEQANKAIAATKTMADEVAKVQNETTKDGLPLTVGQKKEIAVQNFRKRAAQQLKDGGMDISTEKVNNDADDQIKNIKSQNTHLPLEETEAFKTATEVDKEGKEIGKPKDVDDIEPGNDYKYSKNGRETTTTGLKLLSHLPQSEKYEEPVIENSKSAEGENKKTTPAENKSAEGEIKPDADKVKEASDLLQEKVKSGEVQGVYADEIKKDPTKSEGLLKEIAQQAHGIDAEGNPLPEGGTDGGMPKDLVDAAKEAFPKESFSSSKTNTNEAEKSQEQGQSQNAAAPKEGNVEGNGQKVSEERNVNPDGASVSVEELAPSKQSKVNDLLDKITEYNSMKSSNGEAGRPKRELLNKIRLALPEGYSVDYGNGHIRFLKNENGNPVQKRNPETNRTKKEFSKEGYRPDTKEFVSTMADHGNLTGIDIMGSDGIMMSESQKNKALEDIKNGVDTMGAKSVYDAANAMHEKGAIEVSDRTTGKRVSIPVKDFMDEFNKPSEPLSDDQITELNSQLGEEAFNKAFDEIFDNETNENESSTEPVSEAEQPPASTTEPSTEKPANNNENPAVDKPGAEPGSQQPGGPAGEEKVNKRGKIEVPDRLKKYEFVDYSDLVNYKSGDAYLKKLESEGKIKIEC